MDRLKQFFDWDAHPLTKGFVGTVGSGSAIASTRADLIDPMIKAVAFYGGAVVVVLTTISLSIDIYRKLRKKP